MFSRCDSNLRVFQNTNLKKGLVTSFLRKMKKSEGLIELGDMNPTLCCVSFLQFYH